MEIHVKYKYENEGKSWFSYVYFITQKELAFFTTLGQTSIAFFCENNKKMKSVFKSSFVFKNEKLAWDFFVKFIKFYSNPHLFIFHLIKNLKQIKNFPYMKKWEIFEKQEFSCNIYDECIQYFGLDMCFIIEAIHKKIFDEEDCSLLKVSRKAFENVFFEEVKNLKIIDTFLDVYKLTKEEEKIEFWILEDKCGDFDKIFLVRDSQTFQLIFFVFMPLNILK